MSDNDVVVEAWNTILFDKFVRAAQQDARSAGVRNVSFFTADVQSDDLRGPYGHAFARFGTMFFTMPGRTFMQVVWRKREDNPWLHEAEPRVREIVPGVSHGDAGEVRCGPGPFSMSGPDMLSARNPAA